jgi:hypothetical protein
MIESQSNTRTPENREAQRCRAHQEINEWQIRQYRKAIEENMWYMGEQLGRAVTWEEAEHDFLHNEYYGCAPKWRKTYCANRCHHFMDCILGQRFVKQ